VLVNGIEGGPIENLTLSNVVFQATRSMVFSELGKPGGWQLEDIAPVHSLAMINVNDGMVDGVINRAAMAVSDVAEILEERCSNILIRGCGPQGTPGMIQ